MKVAPGSFIPTSTMNPTSTRPITAGPGVYTFNNQFYASKIGTVVENEATGELSVVQSSNTTTFAQTYPSIGSIVIGKVTKINSRHASVVILVVDGIATKGDTEYQGIIQKKDTRQARTDTVEIYKCFRPGDVVKAKVVSLGEQRHYILSTASNELGVVLAQSLAGYTMIPISWEKMVCPVTKEVEFRKCAKPEEVSTDVEMA